MPDESEDELAQLRAEKKRVRAEVYDLASRLNAGETGVRAALDAARRRRDELEARLNPPYPAPVMYGPPAMPDRNLAPTPDRKLAPTAGEPPRPPAKRRGFLDWLFGRK